MYLEFCRFSKVKFKTKIYNISESFLRPENFFPNI